MEKPLPNRRLDPSEVEEIVSRTIHLRFLPTGMKQSELAALCNECGPYNRVRICGGQNTNQNWIYGFVEFATVQAASKMMRKSGLELGPGNNSKGGMLRLKCHTAREPIVDRVFHDADPAKGTPCQFGQGNFANRTLREALDSYFSLLSKATNAIGPKDALLTGEGVGSSPGASVTTPPTGPTKEVNGRTLTPPAGNGALLNSPAIGPRYNNGQQQQAPPPFHNGAMGHRNANGSAVSAPGGPMLQGILPRGAGTYNAPPPPPPLPMPTSHNSANNGSSTTPLGTKTTPLSFRPSVPSDHSHNQTITRCLTYLDSAMRTGALFAKTRTASMYHDAMASLQAILDLLHQLYPLPSQNAASSQQLFQSLLLPTANAVSAVNATSSASLDDACNERTNAVREIRVAVHVIATMLHLHRGAQQEAIPHISRVLDLASGVTLELLERPTNLHILPATMMNSASAPQIRSDGSSKSTTSDDDEHDDDAFLKALSLVHVSQPSAGMSQQLYDVAFQHHCYLVNALLAIGFAMEAYHSLIARCVYTMARRRAASVLHLQHPALDKALRQGGVHELRKQLCPGLFATTTSATSSPQQAPAGGAGKTTDAPYPLAFFTSFAEGKYETQSSGRTVLPPLHCSAVFPLRVTKQ